MSYTESFYDTISAGSIASAAVLAPIVYEMVNPSTVVDVGCGQGHWGAEFAELGATVHGIDGDYVTNPRIPFTAHNLEEPLPDVGTFDLAVCLEVAEHLTEQRAASFIAELCALAPTVLFSAAIPHQSGAGHINLQWQSWWATLFTSNGYKVSGSLRWQIWDDPRVEPWYQQNVLLASKTVRVRHTGPMDVVHPVIHEWAR
jgi:SAM-dependent methyltransferase